MTSHSDERRTLLGTTITPGDAIRDMVLAGVFTMVAVWVAYGTFTAALMGLVGGGFLGVALHVMPPEPHPEDSKRGRIIIRAVSGAAGGAGVAGFLRWLFDWAGKDVGTITEGALLGAVVGLAWYTVWGFWETRNLRG